MSRNTSGNSVSPTPTSAKRRADPEFAAALGAYRSAIRPAPRLSLVEWAERHRHLSRESSHGGKFIVSRVEAARGPMLAVTEPGVKTITLQACTQLLKTTLLENIIGYFAHLDPCPILVVQPKDDAAETFSKDRLSPMIRDTPALRALFSAARSRDAGNTLTHKQFVGGHVTMVGASSPTNLAMRPIRVLLADEVDKYPLSAGAEGDPVTLAEERQAEFSTNSLSVRACSPTIQGRSAIETSYLESDQRRPFVVCPHCGGKHEPKWEFIRWSKDDRGKIRPETAAYHCPDCGVGWTEADRLIALSRIWWRQTRVFDCCGRLQTPEAWDDEGRAVCGECGKRGVTNEHAGFLVWKFFAPKQSLRDLVKKWSRALDRGPEAIKTFANTQLARTWKEAAEAPEWDRVYERRDAYRSGAVPAGALVLFAGVDVQKDRLEAGIWGFGRSRQRWLIEHRVLPGETNRQKVWADLAAMMDETWLHESGLEFAVRDWGIDSGSFASEVYAFVRAQAGRGNVHAVDGRDDYTAAYIGVGGKDANSKGKKLRKGLKLVKVGVSFCKQELNAQLALARPGDGLPYPLGFLHLPHDVSEDQVKQLTAEELVTKTVHGKTRRHWAVIEGRRNEVLDCFDHETEVLTEGGWLPFYVLSLQERLATVNLATDEIEYQVPTQLIARQHAGEMVSIEGRRLSIMVTPNHRMVTYRKEFDRKAGKWRFDGPASITLAKDLTIHHQIKMTAHWRGNGRLTMTVPESRKAKQRTLISPAAEVDAGDLAELLGWYVSEGCRSSPVSKTQGNRRYRVELVQNVGPKLARIEALVARLPWKWLSYKKTAKCRMLLCLSKQLHDFVGECGDGVENKRVPSWIKDAPAEVIGRFLDSAVLGDGWTQRKKASHRPLRTYATISPGLADDIQELFIKVGCASNVKVRAPIDCAIRDRSGRTRLQYHVTECKVGRASLGGGGDGKRSYLGKMVPYDGMVYCATVPNGTLICRRHGRSFIAGNCANYARGLAAMRGWDRWREPQWKRLEEYLGLDKIVTPVPAAAPAAVDPAVAQAVQRQTQQRRPQQRVIRSGYMD